MLGSRNSGTIEALLVACSAYLELELGSCDILGLILLWREDVYNEVLPQLVPDREVFSGKGEVEGG